MLNMLLHLADVFLLQFDHASAEEVHGDGTLGCRTKANSEADCIRHFL